jgi:hypothetical protein
VRTHAHVDLARDLPEGVLCTCTICQDHLRVRGLMLEVADHLNNENVVVGAFEVDSRGDGDVCVEGIDPRSQWSSFVAVAAATEKP